MRINQREKYDNLIIYFRNLLELYNFTQNVKKCKNLKKIIIN